jgi:hypothetical protein
MIICTTTLSKDYEVIDTLFVTYGETAGGFMGTGGIDTQKGFQGVKAALAEEARKIGADAVIGVDFEQRVASDGGMINEKQVLEFFAYGTAVKFV